jgi:ketosteroid isomerase-like protein
MLGEIVMTEHISTAEVFERMCLQWLDGGLTGNLLADDVVIETPFAPEGRPRRFEGRAEFQAFAEASQAAMPVRIEDCRNVVIHQTTNPEVIVAEYELVARVGGTGHTGSASFIGVLTARDGQVVQWREYQNALAMAAVRS